MLRRKLRSEPSSGREVGKSVTSEPVSAGGVGASLGKDGLVDVEALVTLVRPAPSAERQAPKKKKNFFLFKVSWWPRRKRRRKRI